MMSKTKEQQQQQQKSTRVIDSMGASLGRRRGNQIDTEIYRWVRISPVAFKHWPRLWSTCLSSDGLPVLIYASTPFSDEKV